MELIEEHWGEHCHEPIIARVLHEAAKSNKIEIVRQLLRDNVHPDARIKQRDKTAFEAAGDAEVRKLLYEQGAKIHPPPSICTLTYWQGIDSKPSPLRQLFEESKMEVDIINGMGDEEFRGLIVDTYSLKEVAENSPEPEQTDPSVSKPMAQLADHELHSIAHPTVDEMIYGKGPDDIMKPKVDMLGPKFDINTYKRYRWIHIPMNHVSPASRTLIFMANH